MTGMVPEDVFELTGVSDPRLSPDGTTVAYGVWTIDKDANEYRGAIWLAAVDGSTPPRQFTTGTKRDGSPRWSPDSSQLAFTSNREKDQPQLYVIPATGGEPRRLTDIKEVVGELAWSPDGSRILFSARVPDPAYDEKDDKKRPPRVFTRLQYKLDNEGWTGDRHTHLFAVPADGSADPKQITEGEFEDGAFAWFPDGSKVAFISARDEDWDLGFVRDVYVVDASGGEPKKLTHSDGAYDQPSFSPDGGRIAVTYYPGILDDPRHTQVAVVDAESGERDVLTDSLDRNCSPYPPMREPIWDGTDLLFAVEDQGNTHLYRVPADGSGKPELVTGGDLMVTGYDAAAGRIVHSATTPTSLSELYSGDQRLTDVGKPFTEGRELVAPQRFTAVSADGTEVEAWVIRPAAFEDGKKYPALLNIHGGPFTQYGNKFFDEFQVYAGAGYVVVYSNPRGSAGYSEEWGRAIRGPGEAGPGWGTVDYEDCMAVMDEAVKR